MPVLIPTPEEIDAFTRVGFVGALVVGMVLLGRGIVIFRREKDAGDAERDARLAEMRADRDGWKAIAERAVRVQEKLADVAEGQGRDLHQLAATVERLATILEVRGGGPPP